MIVSIPRRPKLAYEGECYNDDSGELILEFHWGGVTDHAPPVPEAPALENPMRIALALLLLPAVAFGQQTNPAYEPIEDVPGLPRVLLLGDSISSGYTLDTRAALEGKANVHRPGENCGPTIWGLERIDAWLGEGDWDVIHVNFGLHDLKFVDEDGKNASPETGRHQVPIDEYRENLRTILSRLKETGATVIVATTTPVPPGEPMRRVGDDLAYNAVAREVAEELDLPVNDLHGFISPRFEELAIRPGNVHFTDEGSKLLGDHVAEVIGRALEDRR